MALGSRGCAKFVVLSVMHAPRDLREHAFRAHFDISAHTLPGPIAPYPPSRYVPSFCFPPPPPPPPRACPSNVHGQLVWPLPALCWTMRTMCVAAPPRDTCCAVGMPERCWRVTAIVVLWPSNAHSDPIHDSDLKPHLCRRLTAPCGTKRTMCGGTVRAPCGTLWTMRVAAPPRDTSRALGVPE